MNDAEGSFFFFKQKTAYEMLRSLVGSEMCIRDRGPGVLAQPVEPERTGEVGKLLVVRRECAALC